MGEALEFDTPVHPAGSIYARTHTALGFPHVVSPLGWSLVGPLGEQSARRTWEEGFGFFKGLSDDPEHRFIGRFGGRVYGNVSTFREMSGRTPGADWRHTDDELVGIGAAALPPHAEPSDVRRWWARTLPRAGRTVLQRNHQLRAAQKHVSEMVGATTRLLSEDPPDLALVRHLRLLERQAIDAWTVFVSARAPTMGYMRWATALAERLGFEPAVLQARFAAVDDLESARPALELATILAPYRGHPEIAFAVREAPDPEALVATGRPEAERIAMAFHRVIRRYGHRGFAEADPAEPAWEQRPADAWQMLRLLCEADVDELERRRLDQRAQADRALATAGRPRREVVVRILDRLEGELVLVERGKSNGLLASHQLRRVVFELRRRFAAKDVVPAELFPMLSVDELAVIARGHKADLSLLQRRSDDHAQAAKREVPDVFIGAFPGFVDPPAEAAGGAGATTATLTGIAGAPGCTRGRAIVMGRPDDGVLREGDVLVTKATDTAWTPLFLCAAAVVCDLGAVMSHATIVARDLAIPAVVDVRTATSAIRTGDLVEVDGTRGTVTILERG